MDKSESREFWVEKANLPWLLLLLSRVVNYKIDSSDLDIILYDLTATAREQDLWAATQLVGEITIDIRLARDMENTNIIFIRLLFEKQIVNAIDVCIMVVQDFYLSHKHYHIDLEIYE